MRSLKAITRSSFCLSRKKFKALPPINTLSLEVVKLYVREWGINRKELAKKFNITISEFRDLERENPLLKQTIKEAKKCLEDADNFLIETGFSEFFTLKARLESKKQKELYRKRTEKLFKELEKIYEELQDKS